MSIRRDKGELVCICDECGHEQYGGTVDDFAEFWKELKADGWRARKDEDDGEWSHTCPDCEAQ